METFERREKKFLLTKSQYDGFMSKAQTYLQPCEYFESVIQSVYFDTDSDTLIRRSMEKPLYKEKLRVRKYLGTEKDSLVYIELKKKFKGIGYKRRTLADWHDILRSGIQDCAYESEQIGKEIRVFDSMYPGLHPRMKIKTTRHSYLDKEDPRIRITFDFNVSYAPEDLDILEFKDGEPLLSPGSAILEIKAPGNLPLRYTEILTSEQIYRRPFSKYATAYKTQKESEAIK